MDTDIEDEEDETDRLLPGNSSINIGHVAGVVAGNFNLNYTGSGHAFLGRVDEVHTYERRITVEHPEEVRRIRSLDISSALDDFEARCKALYKRSETWMRRLPWQPEIPVESFYVDLQLEIMDRSGKKLLGVLKDPSDVTKAWKPGETAPRSVLLSGPGGSGKTTFLNRLAYQWATTGSLGGFKGLLLYSLRNLENDENLSTVIDQELSSRLPDDPSLPPHDLLTEVKKHTLILLDGYDELSKQGQIEVMNYLKSSSSSFSTSNVVVTTRNAPSTDLLKCFERYVRIANLKESSVNKIIAISFSENPQKVKEVKNFLKSNKRIATNFQSSPLMMYSLCYVLETATGRTITKSRDLCSQAIFALLRRKANNLNIELTDCDVRVLLFKLGELFLECLQKRVHKISSWQFFSHFTNHVTIILKSGLFYKADPSKPEYQILHLVFMESLAVDYYNQNLSRQEPDLRRLSMLNDIPNNVDYSTGKLVMWDDNRSCLVVKYSM